MLADYEIEECDPEGERRVFHVLDAGLVVPPPPGRKRGRAPKRASRYYWVCRLGPRVAVQRVPNGELRLVLASGCTCPGGVFRRPCVHRLIAGRAGA